MPSRIVFDFRGVIKRVAIRTQGTLPRSVTQYPIFLKVRNVSDFPKKRIDRAQEGYAKLLVRKVTHKIERAGPGVDH